MPNKVEKKKQKIKMIHIDDIKARLKINSEPKEVSEMREHILSSFQSLEFIDEGHIYNLHNTDGIITPNIPSASAIIKRFEPEEDWDMIAERYALNHEMDVKVVKRMWKENNLKAITNGTSDHLYGEYMQRFVTSGNDNFCEILKPQYQEGFFIPYGKKQEAVLRYWEDAMKVSEIYPLLPEVKMFMPLGNKYGINEIFCGTADITFAYKYNGKWCILQEDYKTNTSLTNDFSRSKGIMMKPPFDNLVNEALSHYMIQQGLYSMMLENLGYEVLSRKLVHLKADGTYEKVKLPYIKEQLIECFNDEYKK